MYNYYINIYYINCYIARSTLHKHNKLYSQSLMTL